MGMNNYRDVFVAFLPHFQVCPCHGAFQDGLVLFPRLHRQGVHRLTLMDVRNLVDDEDGYWMHGSHGLVMVFDGVNGFGSDEEFEGVGERVEGCLNRRKTRLGEAGLGFVE